MCGQHGWGCELYVYGCDVFVAVAVHPCDHSCACRVVPAACDSSMRNNLWIIHTHTHLADHLFCDVQRLFVALQGQSLYPPHLPPGGQGFEDVWEERAQVRLWL